MPIKDFLVSLIASIVDGNFQRRNLIRFINQAFKEAYILGNFDKNCNVSIVLGDADFRHQMSSFRVISGCQVSIENDYGISITEIMNIATPFLINKAFLSLLMSLGFDTLIVKGKYTKRGKSFCIHKYASLNDFILTE